MPKRVSLKQVSKRAYRDRDFFRELLRDPAAALEHAGLELAPEDLKKLKAVVRRKRIRITIDVKLLAGGDLRVKARADGWTARTVVLPRPWRDPIKPWDMPFKPWRP